MTLRLDKIEMTGFRGVPKTEIFQFNGANSVILGPNGTGKSTIGQALEYLLRGKVSSLTGTATGRINERTHLINSRADPVDVCVEAGFTDDKGSFTARREFTGRGIEATRRPPEFEQLLNLANQGLLKLTREQILDLVVSTPGNRKKELQTLLNVEEIDTRRLQLNRLAGDAEKEAENSQRDRKHAAEQVREALNIDSVTSAQITSKVNQLRVQLGGEPIEDIDSVESFRVAISGPAEQATHPLQQTSTQRSLENLTKWFETTAVDLEDGLREFVSTVEAIQGDKEALTQLSEFELVEHGQTLVNEQTAECPLCLHEYEPGELVPRLNARRLRLQRIENRVDEVQGLCETLQPQIARPRDSLRKLISDVSESSVADQVEPLSTLHDQLGAIESELEHDFVTEIDAVDTAVLSEELNLEEAQQCGKQLVTKTENFAPASTLQQAWDDLRAVEEGYTRHQSARKEEQRYDETASDLWAAHEQFLDARDTVLENAYAAIADSFNHYYTHINPDEAGFDSTLSLTDTGLEFSVGFHDGGSHAPHALHSEGHQDSIGVCLFLALVEQLSPLEQPPVVLDDIVTSVDAGHRERIAGLLTEELSTNIQFIVTTYNDSWARQLDNAGFVEPENLVRFEDWTPEQGPIRGSSNL